MTTTSSLDTGPMDSELLRGSDSVHDTRSLSPPPMFATPFALTRGLVNILLCLVLILYTFLFLARSRLPEKYQRDSLKLVGMVTGELERQGSFGATADLLTNLPEPVLNGAVYVIGLLIITSYMTRVRTLPGLISVVLILVPTIVFCLLFPMKDTFVVVMTLLISTICLRVSSHFATVAAIVSLYCLYGTIRMYYLIIVAVFVALYLFMNLHLRGRIIIALLIMCILALSPNVLFQTLQEPRDQRMAVAFRSTEDLHRTAFGNLVPPDNVWNFLCNYFYAALVLNLPVVYFFTAKSFALLAAIVYMAILCRTGLRFGSPNVAAVTLLFISHPLVLVLFEGDLGSYCRHLISAAALLIPAFSLAESRQVYPNESHVSAA
jgi:hypothetical protein